MARKFRENGYQAETILANLCRGSGLAGLAGMHAVQRLDSGLHLVRPMLEVRRSEIDAYLKSKRLKFREDASNQSPKHRRNRLRHEALPLLNDVFARDVVPQVVRLGSLAEQDDDCLQRQAFAFLTAPLAVNEDRSLSITKELLALHPAVLSRVFALWFREVRELPGIEHDDIEAAMSMLAPEGAAKINLPHDKHLRRKAKKLWVESSFGNGRRALKVVRTVLCAALRHFLRLRISPEPSLFYRRFSPISSISRSRRSFRSRF